MPAPRRARSCWREPLPGAGFGLKPARVMERLGRMGDARSVSLVAIHTHDIPTEFSEATLAEAERARGVTARGRTDLRDVPLITIDGEDARDFDDAVFAEADGDGFRLLVAIADVAHYVRPDSALDRAAWTRGNSVLLPRPRRADAAGGAVERLVQPAPGRRPRLPVRRNARSTPDGTQAHAPLRPRPDAQRRAPDL